MVFLELCLTLAAAPQPQDLATVAVVVGAPGEEAYGEDFEAAAALWRDAAQRGGAEFVRIDQPADGEATDQERLVEFLEGQSASAAPLWLVLIGHGTFDGNRARFALRGPDVWASRLGALLDQVERPQAVIVCASASSPFINRLSKPGRVVVTATRSGAEVNYSRFAGFLATAIGSLEADLDADRQVSLLEAFLFASARTTEWYRGEARLATEHALIDDNGDGLGAPIQGFRGVRATHETPQGDLPDGAYAHRLHLIQSDTERALTGEVRQQRDAIEGELEALRAKKAAMGEDAYYAALEELMLRLAELYR